MLDTDEQKAQVILARMEAFDEGQPSNQPQNQRLVTALARVVVGFRKGTIHADIFVEEAITAMLDHGYYEVSGAFTRSGETELIRDTCLDRFTSLAQAARILAVTPPKARRALGQPDTTVGGALGWRMSTIAERVAKN